jgi:hypothetical protein
MCAGVNLLVHPQEMIKKKLGCANLILNEVLLTANIHESSRIEDNSFPKREELIQMWMSQFSLLYYEACKWFI